jgi:predicted RNA binding protein YcfA (HicA-like mRNA interferase family)
MHEVFTYREVIQALQHDGWVWVRVRGSHGQFKHPVKPGKVTVVMNHLRHDVPIKY